MKRVPLVLVVVIAAALGGGASGCDCLFDDEPSELCGGGEGEGEGEDVACADLSCVIATEGCDPHDIVDEPNGTTCATCSGQAVCGDVSVAPCETRDVDGPCRVCTVRETGESLFDQCNGLDAPPPVEPAEGCEPYVDDTGAQCVVCADPEGGVLTRSCPPAIDACFESEDGCTECFLGSELVLRACVPPDIEPTVCEAYGDPAAARCVDCYAGDVLLSHQCTLGGLPQTCTTTTDRFLGTQCEECTDAAGNRFTSCLERTPLPVDCQRLAFSTQRCDVCLDDLGELFSVLCEPSECEIGDVECGDVEPCAFDASSGTLCRTCPDPFGGGETVCMQDPPALHCVANFNSAVDPALADCTVCVDQPTNTVVTESCNGEGPPVCEAATDDNQQACEVCFDSADSQNVRYSTCDLVCIDLDGAPVTTPAGEALELLGTPAVARCGMCRDPSNEGAGAFATSCALRSACDDTSNGIVDASVVCEQSVYYVLLPQPCDNPWQVAGYDGAPGTRAELLSIVGYTLSPPHEVAVVSADHAGLASAELCADGSACGCARGDVLTIEIQPGDAVAVTQAFEGVVSRCAENADCLLGGTCRPDGSCTL